MHDFKRLFLWEASMELVTLIYEMTSNFPKEEKYGLSSQLKRSAVSIPSNIAEGAGRGNSNKVFNQFLDIAYGSTCELETQVLLSTRLKLIDKDIALEIEEKISIIQKMIFNLSRKLGRD